MRKLTLAALVSLPLFAHAYTIEELRAMAKQDTSDQLCVFQINRPDLAYIAQDELKARKVTCDWERTKLQFQAMQARQQAQHQAQQQAAQQAQQAEQQAQQVAQQQSATERQMQNDIARIQLDREIAEANEKRRKSEDNDRLIQQGLQLMQNSRPRIAPGCRTVFNGNVANTTCY